MSRPRVARWGALAAAALAGAAAVMGAAAPLDAQDSRALSLIEASSARYAEASTLCADFTQTLSVPLLGDERSGGGRLCQAQPDLFAMRFEEPAGDLVVVDGTWVWIYYPSTDPGTVLRLPVASAPGGFDLHREFLERPAEKYVATYEGTERVTGRETHRIRLVPRSPSGYVSAVVWIDTQDRLLRQVRVEEENESVRTVTLREIELGSKVPEGWFAFTPPPGVQIISR